MASVSQTIPNYLLGISQQPDPRKLPGQLRDLVNGYPDPTLGLQKRAGTQYIAELKDSLGNPISPALLQNSKFFSIFRDEQEQYVAAIVCGQVPALDNQIYVWRVSDGTPVTVTYDAGIGATDPRLYLDGPKDQFEVLTVNDYTFITNKAKVALMSTSNVTSSPTKRKATVRIKSVDYSAEYSIRIQVGNTEYQPNLTTRNGETAILPTDPAKIALDADEILDSLTTSINGLSIPGFNPVTRNGRDSLEISANVDFDISTYGGKTGNALEGFMSTVTNISELPAKGVSGRKVRIANSQANTDDYYVEWVTDGSDGYWEETLGFGISTGLDVTTMPHQLVRQGDGTFKLSPIQWEPRLVGDLTSNPDPSFIGQTIQQIFFFNNRLGLLTEENIVLSQSGDFFNFFVQTALTSVASDPIDISTSSLKPAILTAVVPVSQGLLLFSRTQQFLMVSDSGVFTPGSTTVKTISNYEVDEKNKPVDLGTTTAFVSKSTSYLRVFEMETRGQDENPVVTDISRIIPQVIPSTVDHVVSSPQNSLMALASSSSPLVFMFRYYTVGEERQLQSWFKWLMPGNVLHINIEEDAAYFVTVQNLRVVISRLDLVQSPDESIIRSREGIVVDPKLDLWVINPTATYDPILKKTTVRMPYKHDPLLQPCLIAGSTDVEDGLDIGTLIFPENILTDGGGDYFEVLNRDLSSDELVLGYTYNMVVELPRFYFRNDQEGKDPDYIGSLIVSRVKVSTGLSGSFNFRLKARGSDEWLDATAVPVADTYLANDVPIDEARVYNLPIHQRPENFTLKLEADGPFPVSLLSLKWEGHYTTKFYARR
jgi:hypothetical protein